MQHRAIYNFYNYFEFCDLIANYSKSINIDFFLEGGDYHNQKEIKYYTTESYKSQKLKSDSISL